MAMYAAATPAFERQRSFSSSGNVVGATTAPPARTIYGAYPTPPSPYPAYPRSQPQRVYGHADLVFSPATAPCNCTDCYSTGNVAPHYFAEPYASTSSYVAQPPLQYPANALQPYPPADQPVYRPIPVRAESAYSSYAALPTPSLPSPPLEDQLPIPEPLSYSAAWVPTPAPSPPHFVPPSSYVQQAPSYELPTPTSLPPTPAVPSTGLLAPFSLKPTLDRRRSSGGSSVHDSVGTSMSRRPSVMSLGSPFCGSERSFGSAHGSDENDEARQDVATPFTKKLQMLLNCPEYSEVLRWNADGTQFVFAKDTQQLSDTLSQVFRHGSTHSFVRQLNIYSFKRLTSLELHTAVESNPYPGSPLTSADFAGFAHPLFFRDAPGRICDLTKIKPKQLKKPSARNTSHTGKARPSPYEPVTVRTRALRSDVKLEGIAKVQKI